MEIAYDTTQDISYAVDALRRGGVILYPTDTVWGIGCDATNAEAVSRIYAIKRRSDSKALITLVADTDMLRELVTSIPSTVAALLDNATRPTTVIYPTPKGVATNLLAEDGSLAVRVAGLPFAAELCRQLGGPIVSTSANISGCRTPACYSQIDDDLIQAVDYVCLTGRSISQQSLPSRIVKTDVDGRLTVIRE